MTSQCMQMNVNISESAPRRLDCGFTAHAQNICPRTPWSLIQTHQVTWYTTSFLLLAAILDNMHFIAKKELFYVDI